MVHEEYYELLSKALDSPFGIALHTERPELTRQKLYEVRRLHPELRTILIQVSRTNPAGELWLIKGDKPDAEEPGP